MKALVVDDDGTTRVVLREILAAFGDVQTCKDGMEAVETCRQALEEGLPFDLICLDIVMPAMGGLEALRRIRSEEEQYGRTRSQGAKVIMATASDDLPTIREAFQGLCDAYLVKPVRRPELVDMVYCLCPVEEPFTPGA
ncbi:MAG: response regulator [Bryobacteraceae bacterium]|nr:response regulator [Bryobacteraceae bacterium]